MIMAQEQAILKAQEQSAQIQDFLRQAGDTGRRIDQVELDLWGRMLQLGRQLLAGYVAGYRQGDLGPTLERLWLAAHCFHPECSEEAKAFVAQSMLHLRAIHLNGDWDAFQHFRIKTGTRQLYPSRPLVRRLYRKTG